jgi:hypothetical protein
MPNNWEGRIEIFVNGFGNGYIWHWKKYEKLSGVRSEAAENATKTESVL